ncbi:MAG: S-adenosylmethionine:tRNA ribosyltransferase-isomerase-like protein [uncultured Rubrobacteraceae bacterium]|uniref:S-adenosylmethionine:tRNA ribosyltransferase-isomerase-like protein n=1 Tax=uncultured Rubrobacteraceae bacterium TaxID=349277 RepID=A0A6J4QNM8_9ACTN|nr:MAG: S-adenosylmethionine:tRNA ribosyltransferase-isomerase-like protein [uncultured Rubrobacteraceae bacterium]
MTVRPLFKEHPANQALERLPSLEFDLPTELEADAPPEARGFERDEVHLMVSYRRNDRVVHSTFRDLPDFLEAGDVMVINTSGTMNAAIEAEREDGTALTLHLSTRLPANLWVVEVRRPTGTTTEPFRRATAGETLRLPGGATAKLHAPYPGDVRVEGSRLWVSTLDLSEPLYEYIELYGHPIRYAYVRESWPASYYQTVYATEKGSAEMPSAGRAFTPELITHLVARGIQVAPLILHTGVASLEADEPPYEEFYRVPPDTARLVNAAHAAGKRVVAVGTTVVRALETATDPGGTTHPGEGWTNLIITPERGIRTVDAMLTGLHEPRSTHLAMLEALAGHGPRGSGQEHLKVAYAEALSEGYLWHEFGDLHLILP